jgi:hypothetical protein
MHAARRTTCCDAAASLLTACLLLPAAPQQLYKTFKQDAGLLDRAVAGQRALPAGVAADKCFASEDVVLAKSALHTQFE